MDKKQTPTDTICESGRYRLTASLDRRRYSLQIHNGWDYVEVAAATAFTEGDITNYAVTVYPDPPVDLPGDNVVEALWALTIPA